MRSYYFYFLFVSIVISCSKSPEVANDAKLQGVDKIEILVLPKALYEFAINEVDTFEQLPLIRYVIDDTAAIDQVLGEFNRTTSLDREIYMVQIDMILGIFHDERKVGQIIFHDPLMTYESIEKDGSRKKVHCYFNEEFRELVLGKLPSDFDLMTKDSDAINLDETAKRFFLDE